LDLQLIGCTKSGQEEAIEQYERAVYCAGGSACMTATTLALLDTNNNNTNSKTRSIHLLTKLGKDRNGEILMDFMTKAGANTELTFMDESVATAMSILPIFKTGGRGCFFNLASNNSFTKEEVLARLHTLDEGRRRCVDAFLFGYPHLMPKLQGDNLRIMLESVKETLGNNNNSDNKDDVLIGVDLNGVSADNHTESLLGPALPHVDVLHLNEEEAEILSGEPKAEFMKSTDELKAVTNGLHKDGCAVVILSLGSKGAFVSVTPDADRLAKSPKMISHWKAGSSVHVPAFAIDGEINANGAGDALFSGFCWAAGNNSNEHLLTLEQAGNFASLVARQRCDVKTRDDPAQDAEALLEMVRKGALPPAIS
jgi:sugar/nucleoside kinase (ribokinase family)